MVTDTYSACICWSHPWIGKYLHSVIYATWYATWKFYQAFFLDKTSPQYSWNLHLSLYPMKLLGGSWATEPIRQVCNFVCISVCLALDQRNLLKFVSLLYFAWIQDARLIIKRCGIYQEKNLQDKEYKTYTCMFGRDHDTWWKQLHWLLSLNRWYNTFYCNQ